MDGGRSRTSQEEDEGQQASKLLRIAPQGQEKEVVTQPEPQAWLPAPMFHGEPLMDNTSLRDFNTGEGTYVADALERSLHWRGRYGGFEKPKEAGALPQHEEVLRHGKIFGTCGFSSLCSLVSNLHLAYF